MKVYMAARYSRKQELREYRAHLCARGFQVVSRWLDEPDSFTYENTSELQKRTFALNDWEDVIDVAQENGVFVHFAGMGRHAGYHVEFGIGLAAGMDMIVVGGPENIYHYLGELSGIYHVEDFEGAVALLEDWRSSANQAAA